MQGILGDLAVLFGATLLVASFYWLAKLGLFALETVLQARRRTREPTVTKPRNPRR